MGVGFIMLCHTALGRAVQVARHLAEKDCPVVVHIDRRVSKAAAARFRAALEPFGQVRFSPRFRCEWGTWSLVAATQAAAELMLAEFPRVRHVYAISGACMPLRPVEDLREYLKAHPEIDFIESIVSADGKWTAGGLNHERFTLRFPFSWQRQRWLFDRWVEVQRRLRLRRRIPPDIVPHLGSQWWCLSRRTLEAILSNPERRHHDRYFRQVWIPDESYFQTLARLHSDRIESRSLTLSKFDFQGKPHIFYDDHLQLLRRSDCFFARKIWPKADNLYRHFLDSGTGAKGMAEPNPGRIDRQFARAVVQRTRGRPGLYMQSRFPRDGWQNGKTAAPYSVFEGFAELFEDFEQWLDKAIGTRVHGHLFAPDRVAFAGGAKVFNGALSDSAALRDYEPRAFLSSLIWNTRGERQCFQFGPGDSQEVSWFMATDVNAQISVITGAWLVPLFRSGRTPAYLRAEAARLQQVEEAHVGILRSPWVRARVRIWNMAEFLESPLENLETVLREIVPGRLRISGEPPRLTDLSGFGRFLQGLRNEGTHPRVAGDFPLADLPAHSPHHFPRHLMK